MNKRRFFLLDGIRGAAALAILVRHTPHFWHLSLFHSYLSVDLFFLVSGFVIGHSYDDKLLTGKLTFCDFLLIRWIRLYPIYLLSAIFGSLILTVERTTQINAPFSMLQAISSIALTFALLPSKLPGNDSLFPVVIAYWSLFFEILVNILYACIRLISRSQFRDVVIYALGIVSCLGLLLASTLHGSLDLGFQWSLSSFVIGFLRAAFGILTGLTIYLNRSRLNFKLARLVAVLSALLAVSIICAPKLGFFDIWIDLVSVTVVFPVCILVVVNAGSFKCEPLLAALGAASYPIYVFHLPVAQCLEHYFRSQVTALAPASGIVLALAMIGSSLWLEKVYEIPVRSWLTKKLRRSDVSQPEPS